MSLDNLDGQITPGDLLDLGLVTRDVNGRLQYGGSSTYVDTASVSVDPALSSDALGGDYARIKSAVALRQFRADWFGASAKQCNVVCIGDSITEGKNIVDYANRWTKLLETALRSFLPVSGVSATVGGYVPASPTWVNFATPPSNFPITKGASGYTLDSTGPGFGMRNVVLSGSGSLTLSVSGATSVDLHYYKASGTRTIGVAVDGGTVTNVDASSAVRTDGFIYNIAIPDTGAHTVTITAVASSVGIDGFYIHAGTETKGLRVYEGGHASAPAGQFALNGTAPTRAIDHLGQQIAALPQKASLVVIELGANDYQQSTTWSPTTAATYTTYMQSIISTIKANCTNTPSIVLLPTWMWSPGFTPVETGGWNAFVKAMYDIANADYSTCVLDLRPRFGMQQPVSPLTAGGLLQSDHTHPSDAGCWLIANALARFLQPT